MSNPSSTSTRSPGHKISNTYTKTPISQISGNAEAGTTVEVFDGSKSLGTIPTTSDPDGNWWSLTLDTALGEGTYSFTAKATNAAGKTGPGSTAVEVVVDTTGPGAPVITSPTAGTRNTGISGIDGTAESGSKVEVFNGQNFLSAVAAGNDGKWSLNSTITGRQYLQFYG